MRGFAKVKKKGVKGKTKKSKGGKKKGGDGGAVASRAGGEAVEEVQVNEAGYGIEGDILFRVEDLFKQISGNRIVLK